MKVVNIEVTLDYDVYIGRPGFWGNPFKIGKDGDRAEVLKKYRAWLPQQPELLRRLPELQGKTLGCYCKPEDCHGDILIEFTLNQISNHVG